MLCIHFTPDLSDIIRLPCKTHMFLTKLLAVVTSQLNIYTICARNVSHEHGHKHLHNDSTGW